jgi:hypothetical protein
MTDRDASDDETKDSKPLATDQEDPGSEAEASERAAKADTDSEAADADADADAESAAQAEEAPRKKGKSGKKASRERREREARQASSGIASSRVTLFAALALGAGFAAGWFGHIAQAKAKVRADSAPAAAGSGAARGACGAWEQQLCTNAGEQSALCMQAKAASEILTSGTCEVALEAVPATIAKNKAERAPCDQLMSKLCADLPPGSQACNLVKEKTPAFPTSRCTEMMGQYPEVLANLKQLDEQMAGQGKPGGMPPGMPHGMPPGAPPPGVQATPQQ